MKTAPPPHMSAPLQAGRVDPPKPILAELPPGPLMTWRRAGKLLLLALPYAAIHKVGSTTSFADWLLRAVIVVFMAALAFGLAERRPRRLARWLARWVWQIIAVVVAISAGVWLSYGITTGFHLNLAQEPKRMVGIISMHGFGLLIGPWIALAVMLEQREAFARHLALGFQLERSELERQALDARLKLLQAQVQPHFLFNTLANVRALVRTGSPQAAPVLDSLIAYLRAAVPRLDGGSGTVEQELSLVRAYLELMQLRMPDRLQYSVTADAPALALRCPPMSLLTLVENAVRHGIDPTEEGGRIDVRVQLGGGRCLASVCDTGAGLAEGGGSLGTGLANLRERLRLAFGGDAQLRLVGQVPRGVRAEIEFPAQADAAGAAATAT